MNINFNLNNIMTFVAVAEARSFRAAAEIVHISQSVVSLRIQHLEERLGVPLFLRTTRSVTLTEEGQQLFTVAKAMMDNMEAVVARLKIESAMQSGEVIFACLPSLAQTFMPSLMSRFSEQYPDITLRLFDVDSQRCQEMLDNGSVDFAVVSNIGEKNGVEFKPLFWDECSLVIPKNHPLARLDELSISDMTSVRLMVTPQGTTLWDMIEQAFKSCGVELSAYQQIWNMATLVRLVEEGFGAGIIPAIAMQRLDLSRCKVLKIREKLGRHVGVARKTEHLESAASRAFRMTLHEQGGKVR